MRRLFSVSLISFVAVSLVPIERLWTASPVAGASQQEKDAPIDFNKARALLKKRQDGEKLSAEEAAFLERAMEARKKRAGGAPRSALISREKTGLKPLTEMTADDRYQGQDGGLYGNGLNSPPELHRQAALAATARIQPLNDEGKLAADGRIVLVSISMSNATQEFSTFKRIADADPSKSDRLTIVDCAQGGQAMAEWVDPEGGPWREAKRRIAAANVTLQQVQVAWIKLANKGPRGDLKEHGKKLQQDTLAVIRNAKSACPNLQIAYLGSRIYAGYTNGPLNPEPYAYESAFVVRWLIQDQIDGEQSLNADPNKGSVVAPVLLWGPYFWGDGVVPRQADKLVWTREDLAADGTHPSNSGREKVARMLLEFFQTDDSATPWFKSAAAR